MIKGLIATIAILLVATFPATWMLMLFVGNTGTQLSYWGTLLLGVLVSMLLLDAATRSSSRATARDGRAASIVS